MEIDVFRKIGTPVVVPRGGGAVHLTVQLEKISATDEKWRALKQEEARLLSERAVLLSEAAPYENPAWLSLRVTELVVKPNKGKGAVERLPTESEQEQRRAKIREEIEALGKRLDANRTARLENSAAQAAYLIEEWGAAPEGEKPTPFTLNGQPLPVNEKNVLAYFSEPLMEEMLKQTEGAVFGPLGTGGSSGD